MVSKKNRQRGLDNHNKGIDAEDWEFLKAKLNPFVEAKRHSGPQAPYDFKTRPVDLRRKLGI